MTHDELFAKLVQDMWFGNGKDSVTQRLSDLEKQVTYLTTSLKAQKDFQAKVMWAVLGGAFASVAGLIVIILDFLLKK